MKILLQDIETGLYLSRGGCWSDNPDGALAFLNEVRARDFGIYHHLPNAKVVIWAGAPEIPPTALACPANTNLNTELNMNTKENKIQTTGRTLRRASKPGSAKANLPAHQSCGTLEKKARRKAASAQNPPGQKPSPSEQVTVVEAKIDVGVGNMLFIRGQGDGLNWGKGQPLNCIDSTTWVWSSTQSKDVVSFKLLLNDQVWATGEDLIVQAGRRIEIVPHF